MNESHAPFFAMPRVQVSLLPLPVKLWQEAPEPARGNGGGAGHGRGFRLWVSTRTLLARSLNGSEVIAK
jgi:hypothetical protein